MTDFIDATAAAEAVRSGEVSPAELVEAAIARIEATEQLNAVVTPLFESARSEAAGPLPDGPFSGVPFLFKDLGSARAGDPLYMGNRILKQRDHRATVTTALAQRVVDAGFITMGKTNTPEFGSMPTTEPVSFGPSRNPWDTTRSPGGSSGGSAAAVAAGLVPAASAGDGGGSIRIPAAVCGLVGLKNTRDRISTYPGGEAWGGATVEGVVTRTVRDTAGIFDALAGPLPGDPHEAPPLARPLMSELGVDPGRLRIGMLTTRADDPVDPDVADAVEATGELLAELGHHVEINHPEALDDRAFNRHFPRVLAVCTARDFETLEGAFGGPVTEDDVEPTNWWFADYGRSLSGADYLASLEWWHDYGRRMATWWADGFDVLLTPTTGHPAPPVGWFADPETSGNRIREFIPLTGPFNVTGQPAISLPLHESTGGLPIGLQFVGATGREDLLIRLASQLEQARPWIDRRPPVWAS